MVLQLIIQSYSERRTARLNQILKAQQAATNQEQNEEKDTAAT